MVKFISKGKTMISTILVRERERDEEELKGKGSNKWGEKG